MATVLSVRACPACNHARAEVREGKRGSASIYCPECGFQGLGKTPKASAALRGGAAAPGPAAPASALAAPTDGKPAKAKDWFEGLG